MSSQKPSIVFFGNEQISSSRESTKCPSFKKLIESGYTIERLIIKDNPQKSRKIRKQPITELAEKHDVPISRVSSKDELEQVVADCNSRLAVLAAFGMIIPESIINVFTLGFLNIHPSLLPKYRGPTPIEQAIKDDAKRTGVSLMQLSPEMDAGGVYGYAELELEGDESKAHLMHTLGELGAELLCELIPRIIDGTVQAQPQDDAQASYTPMLSRNDATLDFKQDAYTAERHVRAHLDWPGSLIDINGESVAIISAHAVPTSSGEELGVPFIDHDTGVITIESANDTYLCLEELKPAGRPAMDVVSYINGLPRD